MGFPLPSPSSLSSLALCLGFFFLMGQYYQLLPSISVYFLSSPLECTLYQGEEWLVHCDTLSIQNSTWYMTGPQQILTKQRKECFPSAAGFLFAEVRLSFQSESMHWTSLVVQWLRLCAPSAGGWGSVPGRGTRSHLLQLERIFRVARKVKEPACCNSDTAQPNK